MRSSPFLYFLLLGIARQKGKHIGVVSISLVVLFLLSSVLFISSSLHHTISSQLESEPDFVVQRIRGGVRVDAPVEWIDKLVDIYGTKSVTPRVYGRYALSPKHEWALVVGVDFTDEQSHKGLEKLIGDTNLKQFLKSDQMIVGQGVARYLKSHFYSDSYSFMTPEGAFKKVDIFKELSDSSSLISNNMMIMPIDLAREVLGVDDESVTDIALSVPNDDEWSSIEDKIESLYYDIRVITKTDVKRIYENLYNYKGGLFLVLFLIAIVTFSLILYQRYAMVYSTERREIGLLRALGWSISDVLRLKFLETLVVVVISFVVGVAMAYIYVFVLGAPLLVDIFLGGDNLSHRIQLLPVVDLSVLSSIFLLYAVPFVASVLIPVWRVAVTDPKEAML